MSYSHLYGRHVMVLYLNDSWTPDVTGLAYEHMLDSFVDALQVCQPPMALAVYGGWGSGKTSFMRAAMVRLGGDLPELDPDQSLIANPKMLNEKEREDWGKQKKKMFQNGTKPPKGLQTVWFNPWKHQNDSHPMIGLLHEIRTHFSWQLKAM